MPIPHWFNQGSLVLASNNKGKVAEFEHLFQQLNLPVKIIPQGKLNIEDAIEDGLSFVENAISRHVMQPEFRVNLRLLMIQDFVYQF